MSEKTRALVKNNIQGFIDIVLALQHRNQDAAALDLTREAYGAACARRKLYKIK